MSNYELTGPDGSKYQVTAPDNASQEDLIGYVTSNYKNVSAPKEPSPIMDAVKSTLSATLPSADFNKPLAATNDVSDMGGAMKGGLDTALQTLQNPTRISPTISQPGQVAGDAAEKKLNEHGVDDWRSKATNFAVSAALDPQSYIGGEMLEPVEKSALANTGKTAAKVQEVLTGIDDNTFKQFFKDPMRIMDAEPASVTGKAFGEAKKLAGLTEAEERSLAVNEGSRKKAYLDLMNKIEASKPLEPGEKIAAEGSKNLPPQDLVYKGPMMQDDPEVLKKMGMSDAAIKEVKTPTYDLTADIVDKDGNVLHPKGSTLNQSVLEKLGYDIPKRGEEAEPSVYDILRGKHAAQLEAKSNEAASGLIQRDIHSKINPVLEAKAPDVYAAQQKVHVSKMKEDLMSIFPKGKGLYKYLRTISMLGAGAFHGIGALESPIVQAGATLGAKGLNAVIDNPVSRLAQAEALKRMGGFLPGQINPDNASELQSIRDRLR